MSGSIAPEADRDKAAAHPLLFQAQVSQPTVGGLPLGLQPKQLSDCEGPFPGSSHGLATQDSMPGNLTDCI